MSVNPSFCSQLLCNQYCKIINKSSFIIILFYVIMVVNVLIIVMFILRELVNIHCFWWRLPPSAYVEIGEKTSNIVVLLLEMLELSLTSCLTSLVPTTLRNHRQQRQ